MILKLSRSPFHGQYTTEPYHILKVLSQAHRAHRFSGRAHRETFMSHELITPEQPSPGWRRDHRHISAVPFVDRGTSCVPNARLPPVNLWRIPWCIHKGVHALVESSSLSSAPPFVIEWLHHRAHSVPVQPSPLTACRYQLPVARTQPTPRSQCDLYI